MGSNKYIDENQTELIDIIDCNGNIIGISEKIVAHKLGLWHKAFHCWIIHEINGQYYVIFQKRSSNKLICPNFFDISAAGHYKSSEGIEGGIREIKEELGLNVSQLDLVPIGKRYDIYRNEDITNLEICDVFLLKNNVPISNFCIDNDEVEGIALVHLAEGLAFFSGEIDSINSDYFYWDTNSNKLINTAILLNTKSFIPRVDRYFFKVLTVIDLYLKGYTYITL